MTDDYKDSYLKTEEKVIQGRREARRKQIEIDKDARKYRNQAQEQRKQEEIRELYKDAQNTAKNAVEEGYRGYDNFVSSMGGVLKVCMALNKLTNKMGLDGLPVFGGLIKKLGGFIKSSSLGQTVSAYLDQRRIKKAGELSDRDILQLEEIAKGYPDVKFQMPTFQHTVGLDKKGRLNLGEIDKYFQKSDGDKLSKRAVAHLRQGVCMWMQKNDLEFDPNSQKVYDKAGKQLNAAQFAKLVTDEDHGIDAFLSGRFDMKFEHASGPRI